MPEEPEPAPPEDDDPEQRALAGRVIGLLAAEGRKLSYETYADTLVRLGEAREHTRSRRTRGVLSPARSSIGFKAGWRQGFADADPEVA